MMLSDLTGGNGKAAKVEIVGLSADSRNVKPGYLFAALSGTQANGIDFVEDAISQGAVAVLARPEASIDTGRAFHVQDDNPRRRLALLAARFYESQPDTVVAVTGTNGKSSVVDFARQLWNAMGVKAGSLGTLGLRADGDNALPSLTTPDPVEVHHVLNKLKQSGFDHVALEASSHGLAQYRLDGVRFAAAAFTNLSRDHLDYHDSYDDYFLAKLRLFGELLPPTAVAVLNSESYVFEELADLCWVRGIKALSVGRDGDITWKVKEYRASNQIIEIGFSGRNWVVEFPLIGEFQISNALIAAALLIATGQSPDDIFPALETLVSVEGRLSLVGVTDSGGKVYVDYAHTPDALQTVLRDLRPYCANELHVVFGCGGDRDKGKRSQMGEVAAQYADQIVVTDDNPRNEDPASIRQTILAACPIAQEIGDREKAIRASINALRTGDILVIAGKGHEQGQIIGDEVRPFDDQAVAKAVLDSLTGGD